jgi:hypothetical protein
MEVLTSASRARDDLAGIPGLDEVRGGDTRLTWDPEVPADVETARSAFAQLTGKGYSAFRVGDGDERGKRLRRFDATAAAVVLTPPMAGG